MARQSAWTWTCGPGCTRVHRSKPPQRSECSLSFGVPCGADWLLDEALDRSSRLVGHFEGREVAHRVETADREPRMVPGECLLCGEVLGRAGLRVHVQRRHRRAESAQRLERIAFASVPREDLAPRSCPILEPVTAHLRANLARHRGRSTAEPHGQYLL